jgi:leucyl-tRNA synthetase
MREQLDSLGLSFDWDREVTTCEPDYYHWTQWLFLQFYHRGLAYKREAPVNWCPSCATVLANEQVHGGRCERCDTTVTKKQLEQWFFRTTAYAQALLEDLELLAEWPERVRLMQRNWIGRSEGVEFSLEVPGHDWAMTVFTTRIDTVFGVTFMVLAPEHPMALPLVAGTEYEAGARQFIAECQAQSEIERTDAAVEKKGFFTGTYAINPMNGEKVLIWLANYVLMEYGTGAIMAVPAHDQRDLEFARQHGIPVRVVIQPEGVELDADTMAEAHAGDGVQVNSGAFTGLPNTEAQTKIAEDMEARGLGRRTVNYRLRDWCLSRQRYWGCPIPILYCDTCGTVPVPEEDLPVRLPTDVAFTGEGGNPLARSAAFVQAVCPQCGGAARRETDTMDTFVDSSWYFLRYASPHTADVPFAREDVDYWLPVDQYVGGIEHATMHLIYARFFTKVLYDLGLVSFREPFTRLFTQGMICKETFFCPKCIKHHLEEPEGGVCPACGGPVERKSEKMSKSIGNVVAPDEVREKYGADTGRLYILFIGPPEQGADWSDEGVEGAYRFLNRIWRLVAGRCAWYTPDWPAAMAGEGDGSRITDHGSRITTLRRKVHQTVRDVTQRIERFQFNTAVSALMELVNALYSFTDAISEREPEPSERAVFSEAVENLLLLLSPFAPHVADELWERLGHPNSTYLESWPTWDEAIAREETITIVVQVNGKVRDKLEVAPDTSEEDLRALALASERAQKFLAGREVRKVIVVPGRLVNVVG